ncbi:MAG TPA: NAD-dependent epimerase/dehydratase family protein [Solirubrobacteraceae bacterium]|nr:NAD-dependent epimerase/dehydratase family protein [Solirubrobacteraceae bacterium]
MSEICLLTGATGFIGGHLARRLVESGRHVRALARPTSDTGDLERLGAEVAPGDLSDPVSIARAASGATHIVHCGALVSDWATVPEIRRINVEGTRHVLEAALRAGVTRVVHFSSTDVYGHPNRPVDESHAPSRFSNWYSRTKLEAESEVRRASSAGAIEAVILRPATIYGPGSVGVVGEIGKAVRARSMLLIDRGRAVAGLCYIDNLVDAAMLALTQEAAAGRTFNVTDGLEVSWSRFVRDLAHGLGSPPPRFSLPYPVARGLGRAMEQSYRLLRTATGLHTPPLLSRQAVDVMGRDQSFSNARLRECLGWEPRVGYEQGLTDTLAWLIAWLHPPAMPS